MAGETPGAANARKGTRALRWQDDRSTNKIYASGDVSVIAATAPAGDGVRKKAAAVAAAATAATAQRADDKSSDKYYANGGSNRTRVAGKPKAAPVAPATKAAPRARATKAQVLLGRLAVTGPEDVSAVASAVAERLNAGQDDIVVFVPVGESALLRRTRAALDMLVTREKISEDQLRDVTLRYEAVATPAEPEPEVTPPVVETATADEAAFLKPPVSPATDGPAEAAQVTEDAADESDDEDEADNDFLKPPASDPATEA